MTSSSLSLLAGCTKGCFRIPLGSNWDRASSFWEGGWVACSMRSLEAARRAWRGESERGAARRSCGELERAGSGRISDVHGAERSATRIERSAGRVLRHSAAWLEDAGMWSWLCALNLLITLQAKTPLSVARCTTVHEQPPWGCAKHLSWSVDSSKLDRSDRWEFLAEGCSNRTDGLSPNNSRLAMAMDVLRPLNVPRRKNASFPSSIVSAGAFSCFSAMQWRIGKEQTLRTVAGILRNSVVLLGWYDPVSRRPPSDLEGGQGEISDFRFQGGKSSCRWTELLSMRLSRLSRFSPLVYT